MDKAVAKETIKAGQNVMAKIDGKEVGPIYCAQIVGGKATLQGDVEHKVNVTDCRPV